MTAATRYFTFTARKPHEDVLWRDRQEERRCLNVVELKLGKLRPLELVDPTLLEDRAVRAPKARARRPGDSLCGGSVAKVWRESGRNGYADERT